MRKVNIGMMVFCLLLAVCLLGLFAYNFVANRQIDPVPLMFVLGAILTARVFWKRAKQCVPASRVE